MPVQSSHAEHPDRERLRQTFGSVAELYDRARPSYPAGGLRRPRGARGARAPARASLEIGPGTGKATVELVRRGYDVSRGSSSRPSSPRSRAATLPQRRDRRRGLRELGAAAGGASTPSSPSPPSTGSRRSTATRSRRALLRPGGALAVVARPCTSCPPAATRSSPRCRRTTTPSSRIPTTRRLRPPEEVESADDEFRASGVLRSASTSGGVSSRARVHRGRVRRRARHVLGQPRAPRRAARRALPPHPRPHRRAPRRHGERSTSCADARASSCGLAPEVRLAEILVLAQLGGRPSSTRRPVEST